MRRVICVIDDHHPLIAAVRRNADRDFCLSIAVSTEVIVGNTAARAHVRPDEARIDPPDGIEALGNEIARLEPNDVLVSVNGGGCLALRRQPFLGGVSFRNATTVRRRKFRCEVGSLSADGYERQADRQGRDSCQGNSPSSKGRRHFGFLRWRTASTAKQPRVRGQRSVKRTGHAASAAAFAVVRFQRGSASIGLLEWSAPPVAPRHTEQGTELRPTVNKLSIRAHQVDAGALHTLVRQASEGVGHSLTKRPNRVPGLHMSVSISR